MRKIKLFIATALLSVSLGMTALAGEWKQDQTGWWYQNDDGSYCQNVLKNIDYYWYYFDNAGYMKTGWVQFSNGWLGFREDGSCLNPISSIDGAPVGAPESGWVPIGASLPTLVDGAIDGQMMFYNDIWWCSPQYFDNLSDLADQDRIVREPTNALTPDTVINWDNAIYDDDYEDDDYENGDYEDGDYEDGDYEDFDY